MIPAVEYDDMEMWACDYLRPRLATWSPFVDRRFPARTWMAGFAVVVRDDSGRDLSVATASRSMGFTVIGPESDYAGTERFAQRVATLMRRSPYPGPDSPVADCRVRGPYSLDATGRVEFYLAADLVIVGRPILEGTP